MLDSAAVVDAGIDVRDELPALIGADAETVRRQLDALLGTSLSEDELAERIRELLRSYPGTRTWLEAREEERSEVESERLEIGEEPLGRRESAPPMRSAPPSAPPTVPGAPPSAAPPAPDGAPQPRTAFTRIDCPDEVAAGVEFDVVVGLREEADSAVFGSAMELPHGPTRVGVHVTADGIGVAGSWRHELVVEPGGELPFTTLRLTAQPQQEQVREARIQALFSIDGQAIGFGSRKLVVVADQSLLAGRTPEEPEPGGAATLPVQQTAPDLTIWLRTGKTPGALMWTFETAAGLDVPDAPIESSVGQEAKEYAKQLIDRVNAKEGKAGLFQFLRGIGKEVADNMPPELFALLRQVAGGLDRPPLVQLLTEEPYVPWELAWLEPPLDDGAPQFLSAQATVGRWTTGVKRPPLPPPEQGSAARMAVVAGEYDREPGWERLVAAEEEAKALADLYGASQVDAVMEEVLACLDGDPPADVLHFAVHGKYDPEGGVDGLVLIGRETLEPTTVGGYELQSTPFVFLNACQVGTSRELLGDYAGLAHAFLRAGACAVVAPLWSVKDTTAKAIALRFYEQARAGERPAEILRAERGAAPLTEDPPSATGLAYQFFGHPAMTIGGGG